MATFVGGHNRVRGNAIRMTNHYNGLHVALHLVLADPLTANLLGNYDVPASDLHLIIAHFAERSRNNRNARLAQARRNGEIPAGPNVL